MDEPHEARIDVGLFEFRQGFVVKLLAIGAFEIAEFNDGDRCRCAAHRRITCDADGGRCGRSALLGWCFGGAQFACSELHP